MQIREACVPECTQMFCKGWGLRNIAAGGDNIWQGVEKYSWVWKGVKKYGWVWVSVAGCVKYGWVWMGVKSMGV